MVNLDHYEILGVSNDASYREITSAYRRLALQYHPDRNKSPHANEMMLKINTAYGILSDPHKREEYDNSLLQLKKSIKYSRVDKSSNSYRTPDASSRLWVLTKTIITKTFRTLILFFKFIQGR
jgi:curved DNA-binding protein CbpA